MFDLFQFRDCIVRPALQGVNLWSESSEVLLLGTCMTESNFGTYLKQIGSGPALGVYQMEINTHNDIWKNYLHRSLLARHILEFSDIAFDFNSSLMPDVGMLIYNLYYATLMARVDYLRVS